MKLKMGISRKLCELTRNGGTHPLKKLSSCFCSSSSISSSTISSIPETQSQDHGMYIVHVAVCVFFLGLDFGVVLLIEGLFVLWFLYRE